MRWKQQRTQQVSPPSRTEMDTYFIFPSMTEGRWIWWWLPPHTTETFRKEVRLKMLWKSYQDFVQALCCAVIFSTHGQSRQSWQAADVLNSAAPIYQLVGKISALTWSSGKPSQLTRSMLKIIGCAFFILGWTAMSLVCPTGEVEEPKTPPPSPKKTGVNRTSPCYQPQSPEIWKAILLRLWYLFKQRE